MPTALKVTGTRFTKDMDGVGQVSLDGKSLVYSFNNANAPSARTRQVYEMLGNRVMFWQV